MASSTIGKNITLSEYSDKAIAVRGDTKSHKDQLKTLGGRWNPKLKDGAGWIFPKTKKSIVENYLKTGKTIKETEEETSESDSDVSPIMEAITIKEIKVPIAKSDSDWNDPKFRLTHINAVWVNISKQYGLVNWKFSLSGKMTSSGGICYCSKKHIALSKIMVNHPKTTRHDAENTLLHEVAHAIDNIRNGVRRGANGRRQGHDNVWKKIAVEIGCSGDRCHAMEFAKK